MLDWVLQRGGEFAAQGLVSYVVARCPAAPPCPACPGLTCTVCAPCNAPACLGPSCPACPACPSLAAGVGGAECAPCPGCPAPAATVEGQGCPAASGSLGWFLPGVAVGCSLPALARGAGRALRCCRRRAILTPNALSGQASVAVLQVRQGPSVVGFMALGDSAPCCVGGPAAPARRPTPALRASISEPRPESGACSGFTTAAASSFVTAGVAGVAASRRRSSARVTGHKVGVGVNGFGRIGPQVARIAMKDPEAELTLVSASNDAEYLAYQMKYDSIHGTYDGTFGVDGDSFVIDGHRVALSRTRDPAGIPFQKYGADYVGESSGEILTEEKIQPHLQAGANKVAFSALAGDDGHPIVMGVDQDTYNTGMKGVSCASYTNGLAPTVKAVNDAFGSKRGLLTTIHAMTASPPTVDGASKQDWRGGRAASGSIATSSTAAARAVAKVVPEVARKLTGMVFRVLTIDASVVDFTRELDKATTYEEICAEIKRRSEGDMKGFLGYCDEALAPTDFEGGGNG